jgi:hypothetical protein
MKLRLKITIKMFGEYKIFLKLFQCVFEVIAKKL